MEEDICGLRSMVGSLQEYARPGYTQLARDKWQVFSC